MGRKLTDTHKENVRLGIIAKQGRPVNQYTLDGVFLRE